MISAASARRNVGGKAPSRKRPLPATEVVVHHSSDTDAGAHNTEANIQDEVQNPTILVVRRAARQLDSPPSGPLVLETIAGNIKNRLLDGCEIQCCGIPESQLPAVLF